MDKVIVYVNDADHARAVLAPLVAPGREARPTHWVLVACAPRVTYRVSKWVSHSARENWRVKWADKLFAQLRPWLDATGASVDLVLAKGPLPELLAQLQAEHGAHTPLLDARRIQPQGAPETPPKPPRNWPSPGALTSLGLLCMLAD